MDGWIWAHILYVYFILYMQVFPAFYVLMSGKSAELYTDVFNHIEKNIFSMKPARFMTDFESGLRKAIKTCYPDAALHGCWYHYSAAIRRKMRNLGMQRTINNNEHARKIYRQVKFTTKFMYFEVDVYVNN